MSWCSRGTSAVLSIVVLCSGCASTFNDVKQDLSNLSLRGKPKPWDIDDESDELDVATGHRPSRLISQDLAIRNLPTTLSVATTWSENEENAKRVFAAALATYNEAVELRERDDATAKSKFHDAANQFRKASANWPDSTVEQDSLFMEGESYFFADEYVSANRAFEVLIHKYPGTRYLDHAEAQRFKIANYWINASERKDHTVLGVNFVEKSLPTSGVATAARRILHGIRLDDPTGKLADDATFALGQAFFRAKRYAEAADAFEDLRQSYPGSQHQFDAHLFELKARLASYEGPNYDARPLAKADKLLKQMVRQFPKEIREREDLLGTEAVQIRNMLAARDMTVGEYFESRGENRAAGIYYQAVAENYQETELADQAQERVAAISDLPAVPAQTAEWFVNMFPGSDDNKPLIDASPAGTVIR